MIGGVSRGRKLHGMSPEAAQKKVFRISEMPPFGLFEVVRRQIEATATKNFHHKE